MQAEAPSWGPVTEIWTTKSKTDYEGLQARFKAADIDGYAQQDLHLQRALFIDLTKRLRYGVSF